MKPSQKAATSMTCEAAIKIAAKHLTSLSGHVFDVLDVSKPISVDAAVNLCKFVSKLSPMIGNLIEFNAVEFLNGIEDFKPLGTWIRQDPGFPDTVFKGKIDPAPGFEVKAWFPMATEITARFKDSQKHFECDQTHVVLLAWLPQNLIFGKPYIFDVCVVSGASVAKARDDHYHNPPDYLVLEPGDTTSRTSNLQQTNTNGYKWQGTPAEFKKATKIVAGWGKNGHLYRPTPAYQKQLRELLAKFSYRLDTNFAKIDRIVHKDIETFKARVMKLPVHGRTVAEWTRLLFADGQEANLRAELKSRFGIQDAPTEQQTEKELLR